MNISQKILSDIIVHNKYARYIPEKKRRENWEEIIDRNMQMHIKKFPQLKEEIEQVYERSVKTKKILPSMRSLQFAGKPIEINNSRIYNCAYLPIDDWRAFPEVMFLLLGGTGVGYSVQKFHVNKLPEIKIPTKKRKYLVPDSIEGWADSVKMLCKAFFLGEPLPNFDFRDIREKGTLLVTAGGKAPGSQPLKDCLYKLQTIFQSKKSGEKLTTIEVHDMLCHIADAVLSGGIRRCLPFDAKVHTKDGLKEIQYITPGEEVLTYDGYKKVLNNFKQGEQETIKIITQLGSFECTPNHKLAVLSGVDSYIWKTAESLTENDRLLFIPQAISGNSKLPNFYYEKPKYSTTCADITIPKLTSDISYLFGLIAGDGYVHINKTEKKNNKVVRKGKVVISCSDDYPDIIQKAVEGFKLFGIEPKIKQGDGKYKNVIAHSYQLALYFSQWKKPNKEIIIPDFILNGSEETRGSYLAGLLDSDGCVKNRPVSLLNSIYPKFIKNVQNLYFSLGIAARLKFVERKQTKWKSIGQLGLVGKTSYENFKKYVESFSIKKIRDDNSFGQFDYTVPKYLLKNKIEGSVDRTIEKVNEVLGLKTTYLPIKILDVISGNKVQTYDLEVEERNEFVCEGLLVHNSAMISFFNIDDYDMATSKYNSWYETHPERGRANNSAVIVRHKVKEKDFFDLWKKIELANTGEPGVFFTNDKTWASNPCCVSENNWCTTENGIFKVKDLIGKPFKILNDGIYYDLISNGFWKTGEKEVFKIETKRGYEFEVTKDHIISTPTGGKKLENLNINSEINLTNNSKLNLNNEINEKFKKGWLVGSFIGDGNFCKSTRLQLSFWGETKHVMSEIAKTFIKDVCPGIRKDFIGSHVPQKDRINISTKSLFNLIFQYNITSTKNKFINDIIESENLDFYRGLIRGIFDADGCVIGTQKKGISIRLLQVNLNNLKIIQRMLNRLGINSTIYKNRVKSGFKLLPDNKGEGNLKKYFCKATHELVIAKENILRFNEYIGFFEPKKQKKLENLILQYKRKLNKETFKDKIEKISSLGIQPVYDVSMKEMHWFDLNGVKVHNCEISLRSFQMCNLCEINVSDIESQGDYNQRVKDAAFIGTLQASYTDFHYLRDEWKETCEKEALLGIGMTGIASEKVLKMNMSQASEIAVKENERIAEIIKINKAARITCVKPSGTTSLVLGTSSGVHAWYAPYYIRRIRLGKDESIYKYLKKALPEFLEDDFFKPKTQAVLSIPQMAPKNSIYRTESPIELLERVKKIHTEWIKPGHRKGSNTHNVSCTVYVKKNEWDKVGKWMWENRDYYNGLSVLPYDDHTYVQAPFEEITKKQYEEMFEKLKEIDLTKVKEEQDETDLKGEIACSGGSCEIT